MNPMPTIEDIQKMTPEEVAELNRKLMRKLGKRMLTKIAVMTSVAVAIHFALNALESHGNTELDIPIEA